MILFSRRDDAAPRRARIFALSLLGHDLNFATRAGTTLDSGMDMIPDAAYSEAAHAERKRALVRHIVEAALLAGLFAAMAICLAAGPRLAGLLLP